MTTLNNLIGSGNSPLSSQATVGFLTAAATATGSTQGTALLMPTDFVVFTTVAANTGTILPSNANAGDIYYVVNHGANSLSVYPAVGGKISTGATNAAFAVAVGKLAEFVCIGGTGPSWAASVSA